MIEKFQEYIMDSPYIISYIDNKIQNSLLYKLNWINFCIKKIFFENSNT